ncbi:MAG: ECF transporter S component [Clostridia bacterium]|nr:ECF transporter S component [Clostridia bacterium]
MSALEIRRMIYAALYLAIALILPFLTGQIPQIGAMLSPMHIPVLLCGFLCGPVYGMLVGFIAPLLRSVLFGMPVLFPSAASMAFELAAYGFCSGELYRRLPSGKWSVYVSLILSMIIGRIVWGIMRAIFAGFMKTDFTMALFISGALTSAIPGIILHIVLIPVLVVVMEKAGLSVNRKQTSR